VPGPCSYEAASLSRASASDAELRSLRRRGSVSISEANASGPPLLDESVLDDLLLEALASVCVQDGIELMVFEDNCAVRGVNVNPGRLRRRDVESRESVVSPAEPESPERERHVEALLRTDERELLVECAAEHGPVQPDPVGVPAGARLHRVGASVRC
jgi:hypothetical protein